MEIPASIEVRDAAKREVGLFIMPWDTVVEMPTGLEEFKRGAFAGTDPNDVRLRMDHDDPPTGKGFSLEERDDGAYAAFRIAKTSRGDDQLTLIAEGVSTGASIGFQEVPGGTQIETRNGRRVRVHRRVRLREVSTTWRPAYERATVMYVRSKDTEGSPVDQTTTDAGTTQAPVITPIPDEAQQAFMGQLSGMIERARGIDEKVLDRLERLEERARQDFTIPSAATQERDVHMGQWAQTVIRLLTGERVPEMETRLLADLISTDNAGVVPPAYSQELIGVIDPSRPFMQSTRRLPTPDQGMSLIVPKINTRPTVDIQSTEKAELDSTATAIGTVTFNAVTKGGAGDICLQLLKRSSPSFLSLYIELLAEAYAIDSEAEAVDALLGQGAVNEGGVLDPEDASFGQAWKNAFATRLRPDTIWMSSEAVADFIDAKASTTNQPLYSNLASNITVGGGLGGTISGLRPVHVPALDNHIVDVIIGPSRGYAWAEDGTYTLQVDVPGKAGRDVALVGILWFAPLYPAAFTTYIISGS